MAEFKLREPIETQEPVITVDPGLEPGRHRFTLTVVDDDGNQDTAEATVRIVRRQDDRD
jgi:hypothetical protein